MSVATRASHNCEVIFFSSVITQKLAIHFPISFYKIETCHVCKQYRGEQSREAEQKGDKHTENEGISITALCNFTSKND